jgi:SNF2 family DNA or RNA helicase
VFKGYERKLWHVSSEYGKAIFERDSESPEGGKWRIPLGAYQEFYSYLTSLPRTTVQGIPQAHLNIAMLGRQRLEKGYPSVRRLIHIGVPIRLANTLAPFQRGGVDFVYERHGRALIADEMGLGKTIQAIASLAIYHEDWPVLVLTPSGARYHWQNEFVNWLGPEQSGQKLLDFGREGESESQEQEDFPGERKMPMPPLFESQIHVLSSGASPMIPSSDTKVVIVSYGLAPKLAEDKKLVAGMFKCAIVDESHMLKNKNSKRTKGLLPVLAATKRCILLSGTPAFARPMELWPQMKILGSAEDPTLTDEHDFIQKYVKGRSKNRLAELHTVLTGTLMIRRMKNDILKQLPPKVREQALVNVLNEDTRVEFRRFLDALRMGKGALAKIARSHEGSSASVVDAVQDVVPSAPRSIAELKAQVQDEIQELFVRKRNDINRHYSHQRVIHKRIPT